MVPDRREPGDPVSGRRLMYWNVAMMARPHAPASASRVAGGGSVSPQAHRAGVVRVLR
jgi:hypothetical protein